MGSFLPRTPFDLLTESTYMDIVGYLKRIYVDIRARFAPNSTSGNLKALSFFVSHLRSSCDSGSDCVHPNATTWNSDSIILSEIIIYIHVTRILFVYDL